MPTDADRHNLLAVSRGLKILIIGSLTIILVVAAGTAFTVLGRLASSVVVPILVAILLTGLLMPLQVLFNHGLGPTATSPRS